MGQSERMLLKFDSAADSREVSTETISNRIGECIRSCSYWFYFNRVTWCYTNGTLMLEGRVPTYHLKQVLQGLLRDIPEIESVVNDVQVVSATGLSSLSSADDD